MNELTFYNYYFYYPMLKCSPVVFCFDDMNAIMTREDWTVAIRCTFCSALVHNSTQLTNNYIHCLRATLADRQHATPITTMPRHCIKTTSLHIKTTSQPKTTRKKPRMERWGLRTNGGSVAKKDFESTNTFSSRLRNLNLNARSVNWNSKIQTPLNKFDLTEYNAAF